MLADYRACNWDGARGHLAALAVQPEAFGLAPLYRLYGERIEALAADPPPAGWDGVYVARSK
jgi:hypothetical protein